MQKSGTQQNERQAIGRWIPQLGGIRVDTLSPVIIYSYRDKRLSTGAGARTVNLDCVALRNVLKLAVERVLITELPKVKQLKQRPAPQRKLLTSEQLHMLLAGSSKEVTKNGQTFQFYLRLLIHTSAREKEALAVRWSDANFDRDVVTIGAERSAKNNKQREVDFSTELESL